MVSKIAVNNPNAPDMSAFFSWGLKIKQWEELFFITGRPAWAADGSVLFPNDAVAQTNFILGDIQSFLKANDYSTSNLVRIEYTFTKGVPQNIYPEIYALFTAFLRDVEAKPAASTLRIVDSLGLEGLCVEYEFLAAK